MKNETIVLGTVVSELVLTNSGAHSDVSHILIKDLR